MALRNYLYAKHQNDAFSISLVNKESNESHAKNATTDNTKFKRRNLKRIYKADKNISKHEDDSCDSGVVLDDGTIECRNCIDCLKKEIKHEALIANVKSPENISKPRLEIQIQDGLESGESEDQNIVTKFEELHIRQEMTENDYTHS